MRPEQVRSAVNMRLLSQEWDATPLSGMVGFVGRTEEMQSVFHVLLPLVPLRVREVKGSGDVHRRP